MEMPRWSQGGHKVVTLSQGCYKACYNLVQNTKVVTRLPQGCHKVVIRLYNIVTRLLQPCHAYGYS